MSQPNWQEKIEEIEAEIFDSSAMEKPNLNQFNDLMNTVKNWFLALPNAGKALVTLLGIVVVISLLNTVFALVRLLLSLGILAAIFYFAYQLVKKNNEEK